MTLFKPLRAERGTHPGAAGHPPTWRDPRRLGPEIPSSSPPAIITRRPSPQQPIMYLSPKNWSTIAVAECPETCKTCCKDAFSQVAWVLGAMPKSDCKFCENLRYLLGNFDPKKEDTPCDKCLMDDFKKVTKHYHCAVSGGQGMGAGGQGLGQTSAQSGEVWEVCCTDCSSELPQLSTSDQHRCTLEVLLDLEGHQLRAEGAG